VIVDIGRYQIPAADFLFVAAALSAALSVVAGQRTVPAPRVLGLLALYAAALSLSTIFSADRARSAVKLAGEFYLLGLAWLILFHVRTLDGLRRALFAWIAGTVITVAAAAAGVSLFVAGFRNPYRNPLLSIHGSLPEGPYPRVMGLFLNPNMYCAYLVASLAITIAVARAGWMPRRTAIALAVAIVSAAVFSLSPGFGGMLLVLAIAVWASWRVTHPLAARAVVAACLLGATAGLVAISASPAAGEPLSIHDLRPSSRLLTWIGSLQAFPAHPWFGKGLGLEVVHIGYRNPSGIYELLTDAHNTWLSILVQCGVVGLATFIAIVVAVMRGTAVASATVSQRILSGLVAAFAAGFLYQSLSGSFENTRHVWALIGLLAAAREIDSAQASRLRE